MKNRVIILIDGSNFYFKLKELRLHNLLNFDFSEFVKLLARDNTIVDCRYFVGRVKQDGTEKSDRLLANQQKLLANLRKAKIHYSLGFLMKNDGVYHEKGVDVQMAVDITIASYENVCDRIILVSSDTDLAPAIKVFQKKGKIVEYVGFSHRPSVAMVSFCKESRLLTRQDIQQCISKAK